MWFAAISTHPYPTVGGRAEEGTHVAVTILPTYSQMPQEALAG